MAKLYTKQTWTDEVLASDERYEILEDDGTPINENVQINLTTAVAQAGTAVDADRMNHIEDGIDAVDTRLDEVDTRLDEVDAQLDAVDTRVEALEGEWVNYTDLSTVVGWSSFTTKSIWYQRIGPMVYVYFDLNGQSDNSTTTFTLPFSTHPNQPIVRLPVKVAVMGTYLFGQLQFGAGSNVVTFAKDVAGTVNGTPFDSSGQKRVNGMFVYRTADS